MAKSPAGADAELVSGTAAPPDVNEDEKTSVIAPDVDTAEKTSATAPDVVVRDDKIEKIDKTSSSSSSDGPPLPEEPVPAAVNPPLPAEDAPPPLPEEAPPQEDDGWEAAWDYNAGAWYYHNRFTGVNQWENPRVPEASTTVVNANYKGYAGAPGTDVATSSAASPEPDRPRYNPAIHGSYDPNADYAKADAEEAAVREREADVQAAIAAGADPAAAYAATGRFNRFTGKWQRADLNPENYNDEAKSKRQQQAYFDAEAAANAHDGRSLRAERANKRLTKEEVKAFKEKRKAKKEEKRRAWLRD